MTQIPSDKLKMIDSESKMEIAPWGKEKGGGGTEHVSTHDFRSVHGDFKCKSSARAKTSHVSARVHGGRARLRVLCRSGGWV